MVLINSKYLHLSASVCDFSLPSASHPSLHNGKQIFYLVVPGSLRDEEV